MLETYNLLFVCIDVKHCFFQGNDRKWVRYEKKEVVKKAYVLSPPE
jgi:hypothetical protein